MDIRKEDISKMRLRVGICNNEIINAQTELVISHIKKVHKDVSFTKFDIGGGRHFNTSGIAGVPENVLCNMNDVVPWSVAVSDAISAGYIDVGVTGLNELFANDMSEILKQGVTLSAITKRRDTRAVLITKKKRRSADTDNKVKLYTDNYDKLKRCRYIYDNTGCQLLDTIEDCIDMLMENECDGVFAPIFENGELKIDYAAGCAYLKGEELHLTPIEYKLLCLLSHNVGKVLTHTYITQQIWGSSWENDIASLRVFMATLRKKLELQKDSPQYIQTHIGVGYRMLRVD